MWTYTGPIYIPSLMEIAVTAALFTFGAAVFAVLVKLLPVYPAEHELEAVPAEG
jgi:Ni/Fe-hydrogenase subunit HybB-like protein